MEQQNPTCEHVRHGLTCGKPATCRLAWGLQPLCDACAEKLRPLVVELLPNAGQRPVDAENTLESA